MAAAAGTAGAQTGTPSEPVRYVGGEVANPTVHDGALRYILGVENIQVLRANRTDPAAAEDYGWTYNHAPNLTYWKGRFYLQYLSNPVNEHEAPGHTLLAVSEDGREWAKPVVCFPAYEAPEGVEIPEGYHGYMMHQRMGFYTAPDGRLLTLAFYGHTDSPFKEGGIGRVVREVYDNGRFGPIYFIRYSSHTAWNPSNTSYPFYTDSPDKGFVEACDALLADRLRTWQWRDEDRGMDGFYPIADTAWYHEALSSYRRADGATVGLFKKSYSALSFDGGANWSKPVASPTFIMAGGKQWGQRTEDGRYAIAYNPIATQEYRYPLVVVTGSDGILFDDMGVVHGEVPPRRFFGRWKDFGPCYMRGFEDEATPGDGNMWLTYSVNKEDIWISRIPLPAVTRVEGAVDDNFDDLRPGAPVAGWNLYSPRWARVSVADFPSAQNRSLRLADSDPYDYARAIRVFGESADATVAFGVNPGQTSGGRLDIEVGDRHGSRSVRIIFDGDGMLKWDDGATQHTIMPYRAGVDYDFELKVSASGLGLFDLHVQGESKLSGAALAEAVKSFERISFRTGEYRNTPDRTTPNQRRSEPLPGADAPLEEAVFYIDNVKISSR